MHLRSVGVVLFELGSWIKTTVQVQDGDCVETVLRSLDAQELTGVPGASLWSPGGTVLRASETMPQHSHVFILLRLSPPGSTVSLSLHDAVLVAGGSSKDVTVVEELIGTLEMEQEEAATREGGGTLKASTGTMTTVRHEGHTKEHQQSGVVAKLTMAEEELRPSSGRRLSKSSEAGPSRLSSLFYGLADSPPRQITKDATAPPVTSQPSTPITTRRGKTLSVSGPILPVETKSARTGGDEEGVDSNEWERFLDDLNLHGEKRNAMNALEGTRKSYLLQQSRRSSTIRPSTQSAAGSFSMSVASGTSIMKMLPQLTGPNPRASTSSTTSWARRFSISSLAGWGDNLTVADGGTLDPEGLDGEKTPTMEKPRPLEPQSTGGLWEWWSGAVEKAESADDDVLPLVSKIKSLSDLNIVTSHLQSLRIHLTTAKLSWIATFLDCGGLDAIGLHLDRLSRSIAKRTETEQSCLLLAVKCLRSLLNTEPGFACILDRPRVIDCLTRCLSSSQLKLRCQAADVVSAVCVLSPDEGHRLVLDGLAESSVALGRQYRLEGLVDALGFEDSGAGDEDPLVWEWRSAAMGLVNALVSAPDDIDLRCELRAELARRGLTETMVALKYAQPPDSLQRQLDLFDEERREDLEDRRKDDSPSRVEKDVAMACEHLLDVVAPLPETWDMLSEILKSLARLCEDSPLKEAERGKGPSLSQTLDFFKNHSHAEGSGLSGTKPSAIGEAAFKKRPPPPPPPPPPPREMSVTAQHVDCSHKPHQEFGSSSIGARRLEETQVPAIQVVPDHSSPPSPPLPPPPPPPPPCIRAESAESLPASSSYTKSSQKVFAPDPPPSPPPPPPPPPPLPSRSATAISTRATVTYQCAPPPPPPPPPALSFKVTPQKVVATNVTTQPSAVKLKPFFWTKVSPSAAKNTIWDGLVREDTLVDLSDIAEVFRVDSAASRTSSNSSDTSQKMRGGGVMTMLDITRSNNIGIMLARIRQPVTKIKQALLEVDDRTLTLDDLTALGHFLPTAEEMERLTGFEGDPSKLAKPDQYFREIMSIQRLPARLRAMHFRRRLTDIISELLPELGVIKSCATQVQSSSRLKRILQVVLSVGNAMNGSSFRGNAAGFQLDALAKLRETRTAKASPECPTLLHYLAHVLLRSDPTLVLFIEEMPSLEAAARISLSSVSDSMEALQVSMDATRSEVDACRSSPTVEGDRFVHKLSAFLNDAEPKVKRVHALDASMKREIDRMMSFFGENQERQGSLKPEELFGIVAGFANALQKAATEVAPFVPTKPQPEASEITDEEQAKTQSATSQSLAPPTSGRATISRGDLDEAIRSIRGGVRRRERQEPTLSSAGRTSGARLSKMFLDGNR